MTWVLILWVFTKTGAPHFSYVRDLPSQAACEELAAKLPNAAGHHCVEKGSK